MKNIRLGSSRFLGILVSCALVLSACATLPSGAKDLFAQRNDNALDKATIDAVGDKVAEWQIANLDDFSHIRNARASTKDRRGWVHGAMYVGMMNWAALPGNDEHFAPLRKISEEEEWRLGERLFHGDDHIVGQLYLTFYKKEQDRKMIDHTIRQFNQILVADPDVSLELLGDGIPGVGRACQIRWCWCDALFMSPQTWIMLSLATGDDKYMAYADKEFWATTDYLLDPEYNLYYRDSRYFTMREEAGNKIFWSRGNGWVYAGLVNILRILPQDHPSYPRYVQLYKDMSATIASLQHDHGYWSPSLLDKNPNPPPETSGTGFMTYGFAWGLNNGHLDEATYGPVVRKGWSALVRAVGDDGKLGWVQPIGSAPDSVFETDTQLYGVGAFLLAASQMAIAK
jgi:rhamnogalacturonyl hydrolase YesR